LDRDPALSRGCICLHPSYQRAEIHIHIILNTNINTSTNNINTTKVLFLMVWRGHSHWWEDPAGAFIYR
jgi:hypothetical protein